MVAVPLVTPKTLPKLETVATPVLPLVQLPRPPSVSAIDDPTQTLFGPVIGDGVETTDTVVLAEQPVGNI